MAKYCFGCFNFCDFCDCIATEDDVPMEDKVSKNNIEKGESNTWYFQLPTAPLINLGNGYLHILLQQPSLWSKTPPANFGVNVISIPESRLPMGPYVPGRPGTHEVPFGAVSPQMPWEMQYFSWVVLDVLTAMKPLAELAACQLKKGPIQRNKCRIKVLKDSADLNSVVNQQQQNEVLITASMITALLTITDESDLAEFLIENEEFHSIADFILTYGSVPMKPEYAWIDYDLHGHVDPPSTYADDTCSIAAKLNPFDNQCFVFGSKNPYYYSTDDGMAPSSVSKLKSGKFSFCETSK